MKYSICNDKRLSKVINCIYLSSFLLLYKKKLFHFTNEIQFTIRTIESLNFYYYYTSNTINMFFIPVALKVWRHLQQSQIKYTKGKSSIKRVKQCTR